MSEMPPRFRMRAPCATCGSNDGAVTETGAQDVVRCLCGKFQYNAPRTETGKAPRTVSTVHEAIKPKQRARVLMRASCKCEACGKNPRGTRVELHVAHVVSVKRGLELGLTDAEINNDENLMALCDECNLGIGAEPIPLRMLVAVVMARLRVQSKRGVTGATSGPNESSGSKEDS